MEAWREIPARPDPPDPAQPGAALRKESTGKGVAARERWDEAAQPGRFLGGAQPGEPGAEAQPGSRSRSSRLEAPEAQPGACRGGPAGKRRGDEPRREPAQLALWLSRGTRWPAGEEGVIPAQPGLLLCCAGPCGHMPAWGLLYRPSSYTPAQGSYNLAW
jgi:hypothetical protein